MDRRHPPPIRGRECKPTRLLATHTYIDLVGLNAAAARSALYVGVRQSCALQSVEPLFPGNAPSPLPSVPSFPGTWPEVWQVPYPRNPFFTGREDLLTQLHVQLSTAKPLFSPFSSWAVYPYMNVSCEEPHFLTKYTTYPIYLKN